jgi:hypothetical protein
MCQPSASKAMDPESVPAAISTTIVTAVSPATTAVRRWLQLSTAVNRWLCSHFDKS